MLHAEVGSEFRFKSGDFFTQNVAALCQDAGYCGVNGGFGACTAL
jgi:hypothetical protein